MKHLFILAALLGAVACDDPEVAAKAASVLEHGVVEARALCTGTVTTSCSAVVPFTYAAHKLIDGSAIATANTGGFAGSDTRFFARDEAEADTLNVSPRLLIGFSVADGELTVLSTETDCGAPSPTVKTIATDCTGFNLEAFGEAP